MRRTMSRLSNKPHTSPKRTRLVQALVATLVLAIVGTAAIVATHADTFFTAQEIEAGTLDRVSPSGGAVKVTAATPNNGGVADASNGSAIRFTGANMRIISIITPPAYSRCLDNQGEAQKAGNPIITYHCTKSPAQGWIIEGDAVVQGGVDPKNIRSGAIRLTANPSFCLESMQGTNPAATNFPVSLQTCVTDKPTQQWTIGRDGKPTINIYNVGTKTCLDVTGNNPDEGTRVSTYPCKDVDPNKQSTFNQGWYAQDWDNTTPPHLYKYPTEYIPTNL